MVKRVKQPICFLLATIVICEGMKRTSTTFKSGEDLLLLAGQDEIGEPLSSSDFQLSHDSVDVSLRIQVDPIYSQSYFQGDIYNIPIARLQADDQFDESISGERPKRWKKGLIPYVISSRFTAEERLTIARAFEEYQELTCINFVPRRDEADYIHLLREEGCSSAVGRTGGVQVVSLGSGCLLLGIVLHELMHVLGFWHEHSRPDREPFISIVYPNIKTGLSYNFKKMSTNSFHDLSVLYDINSITHYGPYAFSRDKSKPTIINLLKGGDMGQRKGLSQRDIEKINRLYCADFPKPTAIQFPDGCTDASLHCRFWSRIGECERNDEYMQVNCQKSCGQCGDLCSDDSDYCFTWAGAGECSTNPDYMKRFCRKSCQLC